MAHDLSRLTFFFVAGEDSGDLHGSSLIQAIKQQHPHSVFLGHGGEKMKAAGMDVIEHVNDLAIMGFSEVIKHLPYMLKVMRQTVGTIKKIHPDRIILIDYPGFNLRLVKRISRLGIPITYFILPQVWAWKEKRVNILRDYVDQALCIFPFEQQWFEQRNVNAHFVGHPFTEPFNPSSDREFFFQKHGLDPGKPLLTLLPGSRQQEVDRHWNIFLKTAEILKDKLTDLQVIIGKAPHVILNPKPKFLAVETDNVKLTMKYGTTALVASGTATLEAAVMDLPMVVCYRLMPISWWLAKRMAKIPFASMVNLIANRKVVPEFLQSDMTPDNLSHALLPLLSDTNERKIMLHEFEEVRSKLGLPGVYQRAAKAILKRHEQFGQTPN